MISDPHGIRALCGYVLENYEAIQAEVRRDLVARYLRASLKLQRRMFRTEGEETRLWAELEACDKALRILNEHELSGGTAKPSGA